MIFQNRQEAGQLLAKSLREYQDDKDALVLGLARGGVPVAYEIAQALHLAMDVMMVRKIGMPGHEEFAIAAIASGPVLVANPMVDIDLQQAQIQDVIKKEQQELMRREMLYRAHRAFPVIQQKKVILVDDGLATGTSMMAAIAAIKKQGAQEIILAIPVAASDAMQQFNAEVDKIYCLFQTKDFVAVGRWYADFNQVSDEEVLSFLQ